MQPGSSSQTSWRAASLKGPPSTWPPEVRKGMYWRVGATGVLVAAWLAFLVAYAFLWSASYGLFQDIVVIIVSLVALVGGIASVWTSWGMRIAAMTRLE